MPSLKLPKTAVIGLEYRWRAEIDDFVQALAWSPDDKQIAVAAVSGPLKVFAGGNGAILRDFNGHGFGTTEIAWHNDAKRLVSAGQDGKIRLWSSESGNEIKAVAGGAAWVEHVSWSPDGKFLASAAGRKLRLWSHELELQQEYPDFPSTVYDVQWSPDGTQFGVTGYGGIFFYSPTENQPTRKFEWKGSSLVMAWSPDGKYIATGDQDSTVHFWINATGQDLQMYGYPTKVRELAWDKTSRYLATGGSDSVMVWDCSGKGPEGTRPAELKLHEDVISALAFQHKGTILASGGQDGRVALWNANNWKPVKENKPITFLKLDSAISQLQWSSNDKHLAIGTEGGVVVVVVLP
jgi:WD40 repeat protein